MGRPTEGETKSSRLCRGSEESPSESWRLISLTTVHYTCTLHIVPEFNLV